MGAPYSLGVLLGQRQCRTLMYFLKEVAVGMYPEGFTDPVPHLGVSPQSHRSSVHSTAPQCAAAHQHRLSESTGSRSAGVVWKGRCGHQTGQHCCTASLVCTHALQDPLGASCGTNFFGLSPQPETRRGDFIATSHLSKADFKNSPFLQLLKQQSVTTRILIILQSQELTEGKRPRGSRSPGSGIYSAF